MPGSDTGEAEGDRDKMPCSETCEAHRETANCDELSSKHPHNVSEAFPVGDGEHGARPHSTENCLEDANPDDHSGEAIEEQPPDSAEEFQDDYPQFAHDVEAPAQEQADPPDQGSGGISPALPLPSFPPKPPGSPARATGREPLKRRSSMSLRPLLPTSSARLTAAHRAELLRHASFFQERRQHLLDEISRERQAASSTSAASVGRLTSADAEALIENHHERIQQIVFNELDMEVGRALAHASSLYTRIAILHSASNGVSSEAGQLVSANQRAGEPSTPAPPPPPQSLSWTNGTPAKAQREDGQMASRNDMPPIERRLSAGSRLPVPPLVSPGQQDRWPASAGGAKSKTQSDSAAERRRSGSRPRSRSRSGPRLPPPPPMPAGGQGDGEFRSFTAEIFERVVNGNRCWQAEIMQLGGATRLGSERVYAVRAPHRRSRDEAEADAQKLTDTSVDGSKAVRLLAGELARKK